MLGIATGVDVYGAPSILRLPKPAVLIMIFKKCLVMLVLGGVRSFRAERTVISLKVCSMGFKMIISGSLLTPSQDCVIIY